MGYFLDNLYKKSPIWFQQLMVATYGWWWFYRRFDRDFKGFVLEITERNHWSREQFQDYQEVQLKKLLTIANSSPYYTPFLIDAGFTKDADPFNILRKMPILKKETLRKNPTGLLSQTKLPSKTEIFHSSGTTGTPTDIYYSHEFHQLVQAFFEVRNRNWAGVTYRDRRVMFGVRKVCNYNQDKPPFWRFSPYENMAYMSIYHLSKQYLPYYIDFLNRYRPALITGYPNSLYSVANFALESGRKLYPAKAIITTSETVTNKIRLTLEEAWGCRIFDNYCAVEACMLATQCKYGNYHLSPDFGVFEILDSNDQPCKPGQIGRAVCTGLHNTLQPLIRYDVGDAVKWAEDQTCSCGRQMPIILGIEGRIEDICHTPDGRSLLRFDTVFKGVANIREAQVVQEEISFFVINVVPDIGYSQYDKDAIILNMQKHVGDLRIEVHEVDIIARTPSGKFRPVISKVKINQT